MAFLKNITLFAAFASVVAALPQGIRPTATVTLAPAASTTTSASSTATAAASTSSSTSTSTSTSTNTSTSTGINIINNLDQTVYLWSTSDTTSDMQTLTPGGGVYTENWRTNSDGGGISIKMATSTSESSVLQFEYTESDDTLWWDLSCINLDSDSLFISSGFAVTTDDSSCSSATCAAGDTDCADAYQQADDVDTFSCSSSAAFTLNLG
ncbi:Secreted thaumatin-like protein calA [Penicillium canariense]|uniref:Secreted thaumatin-like protein calA n=1 Tax=Penicillium canariense TaxID=189055 RepID=A0A9W9LPV6_9EURO|nr:Secreted thaumatin-like protein calA [Penicillium canariense]KAJ5168596.1 Secreted thaumatin-like protein calA [Penicillium canariense]